MDTFVSQGNACAQKECADILCFLCHLQMLMIADWFRTHSLPRSKWYIILRPLLFYMVCFEIAINNETPKSFCPGIVMTLRNLIQFQKLTLCIVSPNQRVNLHQAVGTLRKKGPSHRAPEHLRDDQSRTTSATSDCATGGIPSAAPHIG